jgi:hypothetical protein
MPLPSSRDLITLDYAYLGEPFVQVQNNCGNTQSLNTAYLAQPFVGAGSSVTSNVYVNVNGTWKQACQVFVNVSGSWKAVQGDTLYPNKTLSWKSNTVTDPYFTNTMLLLRGDGFNGSQNNTFVDSSNNNFAITRNGNATQGSFSPYGNRWSVYFDGNGDFLQTPTNTNLALSSTSYTVECWVYVDMATYTSFDLAGRGIVSDYLSQSDSRWVLNIDASQKLVMSEQDANGLNLSNITDAVNFPLQTWVHVAAVKSGTTLYLFKNGTLVGSTTSAARTFPGRINVGQATVDTNYRAYFLGYISNLRVLKGTALYTSNFTPPTSPLTAITNTSLLTCHTNRFFDGSTNNFAITKNGDAVVRPVAQFVPSQEFSTNLIGGSAYFDGTGDYLTAPNNAAFAYGTGNFTVEGWFYLTASNTSQCLIDFRSSGSSSTGFFIGVVSGGNFQVWNNANLVNVSAGIALNQWYHFAVARNGSTLKAFLNGTEIASVTNSTNWSDQVCSIGRSASAGEIITGYISNLRVLKGTALYTSNFTPPTSPLTAITNTSLLLNSTNSGIFDSTGKNVLETVGNAQISTAQNKFGGSSIYFDGSGDWLQAATNTEFDFGTGDLTLEAWVYIAANSSPDFDGLRSAVICNTWNNGVPSISGWNFTILGSTTTTGTGLLFDTWSGGNATFFRATTSIAQSAWHHVAATISGGTRRLFLNGTIVSGSTTTNGSGYTQANSFGSALRVGITPNSNYPLPLNGYISNLRITKGIARYTANFTPPTTSFPDI